jgi:flagellar basal body-associated protein FliL
MRYVSEVNEIVKRRWRTTGKGWRIFLIITIIVLSVLFIVGLAVWSFFKLVKSLASGVGSGRNMGLYFPATRGRRR